MIFTSDKNLYDTMVSIRVHGQGADKYDNVRIGINGRIDTVQAAILLAKFEIFDEEIKLRQTVAQRYADGLKNAATVPYVKEGNVSAWAQYCLTHPEREKKLAQLKAKAIPTAIYYPRPLHWQGAFKHLGLREGSFPISEKVSKEIFSIPMHPYLSEQEQSVIIEAMC
jgi:UDP-2-acetamido-2-deoxy-ribo-hexuluronate aminotransferase